MAAKLSMKSLAQFMTAGEQKKRTILKNNKFPREAQVIIIQYRDAINAIREFHESGNDPSTLVRSVDKLRKKAVDATPQTRSRIDNNIRAIERYLKYFAGQRREVLPVPKMKYVHSDVTISVFPDLLIDEGGQKMLIKLDFTQAGATDDQIAIMLQLMYEASVKAELGITPKNVLYINTKAEEPHRCSKIRKHLKREIDAACENIAAIWEGIKK